MRYNILLFITRSAHPKCFIIGPLEYQLMSKSVEKMRKASRSMSILLTALGLLFIGLLILIVLTTSKHPPEVIFLLLPHRLRRIRRLYNGFECKAYPDLSRKNIDLPAYFLKKHGIASTSIGAEKHGRWVTFNEVLSLDHGVMVRIRFPKAVSRKVSWIHPETGFDFTIEVGPQTDGNRDFIREVKDILDQLEE